MAGDQIINGMRRVSVRSAHRRLRGAIGRTIVVYQNPGLSTGLLRSVDLILGEVPHLQLEVDPSFGHPGLHRSRPKRLRLEGDRFFWPLCPVLIGPGTPDEQMLAIDTDPHRR